MQLAPFRSSFALRAAWKSKKSTSSTLRSDSLRATGAPGDGCAGGLPPALQGLRISDDGKDLIDEKTGKVINEFGATRFDVAVRAMRGEFDPPAFMGNTERSSGVLLDSLVKWPAVYDFQIVVQQEGERCSSTSASRGSSTTGASSSGSSGSSSLRQTPQELLEHFRGLVGETCADDIPLERCSVKERLGGRYVSLTIPARVQAAHVVDLVLEAVGDDPRVVMKY